MTPEMEAVIRRELTAVATAPSADLTQWMNRAVRRIGNRIDKEAAIVDYQVTERRATLATALRPGPPPPVHYLDGARIACGKTYPVNVVNTTDRDRVTCGLCKQSRAWKETTT